MLVDLVEMAFEQDFTRPGFALPLRGGRPLAEPVDDLIEGDIEDVVADLFRTLHVRMPGVPKMS